MLGYREDGVCVLVEVGDGVILKLDFVLGGYVVGFVVGVRIHWVVGILLDFLCCFGGVEKRRVIFIDSIFVGRLRGHWGIY